MVDDILAKLTKLSKAELDQVISRAKALKQFAGATSQISAVVPASPKRGTDAYDWILGVCASVCRAQGLSALDVEALKAGRLYKSGFRTPIVAVHAHIETFAKGRLQQRTVYRLVYTQMAQHYHWGPPRMVASTSMIPRLLDEMLPGYFQAGLMNLAMLRMTNE